MLRKNFPQLNSLASDNFSGIHPEVLAAIQEANNGHAIAYGNDPWTKHAQELFKKTFGSHSETYIVFNGTGANVCAMKHVLTSWQAIICPESAHFATDECGAIQEVAGCSLLSVPSTNGKLNLSKLEKHLQVRGSVHQAQPSAITITQSTEMGTVYSLKELREIAAFAKKEGLLLHVDGARISNAAATLNVSLKELTTDLGVDILSFGGTKNGLMGADAVVFLKEGLAKNFPFVRKQQLQLASKMRFLSAQFIALLEGDLWLRNSNHSNAMAKLLEKHLRRDFPQLRILYPVEANAVFVQLPERVLTQLKEKHFFWVWDHEAFVARWMTSWDTEPAFIEVFMKDLKDLMKL